MSEPCLHRLFEDQALETPGNIALQLAGEALSYRQLDSRADEIAGLLAAEGVGEGAAVGICLNRGPEMVAAVLGTLKAGAAYVPLHPSNPPARLADLIGSAGVQVVFSDPLTSGCLPEATAGICLPDALEAGASTTYRPAGVSREQPAYIIHTSGSTGRPKGVEVRHRNVVHYLRWAARYYLDEAATDFALFTPLSFDLTVTSLFLPLITGGRVVIYPDNPAAPGATLWKVLADNQVEAVKLTPAHLALLQGENLSGSRIRTLIVGGEQLRADLARTVWERFGGRARIYNEYGPTEATVGCTVHEFDPEHDRGPAVPIGKPIDGAHIYLFDDARRPVAPGEIGEIHVGGAGVAAGYRSNESETTARFIQDPGVDSGLLYATGDLARWSPDGVLLFEGRSDDQIKLHGYRIEPAEIEAVINTHPGVTESLVVLRDDTLRGRALVAYVVTAELATARLRQFTADRLPPYMVPEYFVPLERLPLTPHGKVDRAALLSRPLPADS